MLLKANWKKAKLRGKTVPRGSFVSSLDKLSEETLLTKREIRTAISHLKMTGEVTVKTTNKYSIFTIQNYDLYQGSDTQDGRQATDERQPNDILTTPIEKRNKEIKKKNNNNASVPVKQYFIDGELNRAFADYVEMRNQIKKPMTDRAIDLAIKKLHELAAVPFSGTMDNELAVRILNQSVMNSWQGLFPLKGQKENYQAGKGGDTVGADNQSRRQASDFYAQFMGASNGS